LEFPWVKQIGSEGTLKLKCIYCEKCGANGPWGVEKGTKNLQRSSLKDHDN
jgi:hypothetical protein